ncbi:MAG: hypothetical protein LBK26_04540 [Rickettsiales bacterium]|jgi:hypothetical protein|nr:hypothetical protein [Rickettsiales bacterium]
MSLRNILKTFAFAGIITMSSIGLSIAAGDGGNACALIGNLGSVFRTLRTLAFVGAVFCIAGWAWGYISAGAVGKEGKWGDEAKTKGVALLVGFALLFGVGMILQFLPGIAGCSEVYTAFR